MYTLALHDALPIFDRALGVLLEQLGVGGVAQAAGVTGVAVGQLVLTLVPGQGDLLRVDDDYEVACIHVGREDRLVLAPQQLSSLGSEPAEDDIRCVDDVPGALDFVGLRRSEERRVGKEWRAGKVARE